MKIYLTRHGQTEWNRADRVQGIMDSPLTQEGIEMAELLRESSKNIKFDKVYSSDLKRAEDTAKIVAPDNEIISTPYLREIDVGNWSGRYFNTLKEEDRELYTTYFNEPHKYKREDGESLYEVMDRVKKFFEGYILNSKDKNVLIVSHGVTIVAILNYVEKIDISDFWENRVLRNATFNIIEYSDGEFKVLKKAPKNPVATI
ncbi:histidine phosphatase family protein [Peptoniphilus indolicus]|uniref:Phosphoglycerate mutase n=2 Tax=Peptoniphilus indolicus TaxID=33030 RepID=G4D581_9FIRM|nr:histidine phosphatase family protein [Peptoniphilus indolicus]EGY79324.1 phosphoglycerate mutase [Peptoniphilus indolicus ATCC 29427]SUB74297.1 Alpha-ribazole phosphatase [Peptoniphilus indolicus]